MDTIKNCNIAENIDELKEIRSTIIIIRQYINTFPDDLKQIYSPNKFIFEKKYISDKYQFYYILNIDLILILFGRSLILYFI